MVHSREHGKRRDRSLPVRVINNSYKHSYEKLQLTKVKSGDKFVPAFIIQKKKPVLCKSKLKRPNNN